MAPGRQPSLLLCWGGSSLTGTPSRAAANAALPSLVASLRAGGVCLLQSRPLWGESMMSLCVCVWRVCVFRHTCLKCWFLSVG